MFFLPRAVFSQLPSIYDIAVENQLSAFILFQEVSDFFGFGAFRTQVQVRNDDCAKMDLAFHVLKKNINPLLIHYQQFTFLIYFFLCNNI